VRAITAASPAERIALTEAAIRADRPDVLMTDMNASLPAVLFERRSAPLQVFYQFGMPIWPLRNIDAVFHVWDFDRALVGFDQAICTELTIPYDLTRFASTPDPELVASERAQLPLGRLIGTYGRLAKITPEFLRAVTDAISDIPDVTVVLGGVGDADPINRTLAALGMIGRCVVLAHHVNGHVWGHLMDVFLDTFPQPGGASCLEVIAKGKPVVRGGAQPYAGTAGARYNMDEIRRSELRGVDGKVLTEVEIEGFFEKFEETRDIRGKASIAKGRDPTEFDIKQLEPPIRGQGRPALTRTMSSWAREHKLPKPLPKGVKRQFFRTWVRVVRRERREDFANPQG
jgi:hypothetical protein